MKPINDQAWTNFNCKTLEIPFHTKVLVVDDEKRIRDLCRRMLAAEGFEVEQAENGEAGLRMIEQNHFDIILLDLMMSGMSGFEVLSVVKSLHPDTVVIVITGYATIDHSIEAMKKGAFDFLPKPFTPEDLRLVTGKAIEYIRTLQDIAHEKSRMRVMINLIRDGVLTTDNQQRVALANPAFLNIIGCMERNVIGLPIATILKEPVLLAMIDKALKQPPDTFVEYTEEIILQDNSNNNEKIYGARCIPFRDRLHRNLGTVTVLHDITTLKHLDQAKSYFVSMVAHEIKSPLSSILLQLKVILDGLAGDLTDKQTEILSRSSERIKALVKLTSELLNLAKMESGLINQEKEELNLVELVNNQIELYQEQATAKSLKLNMTTDTDKISVMGNRMNIEELIGNLLTNAIRYTPENGSIQVDVSKDNYACIKVADTGIGIAEKDLERIFERFYRAKNEKTRYICGTGLGLAIVKSIVEAHNGMLKVESKENQGSVFYVYLPCK